jgi:hypothetical protein
MPLDARRFDRLRPSWRGRPRRALPRASRCSASSRYMARSPSTWPAVKKSTGTSRPSAQSDHRHRHGTSAREVDFRTASSAGLGRLSDLEVLELAARDGRVLVTHDSKTMPKHLAEFIESQNGPGVIVKAAGPAAQGPDPAPWHGSMLGCRGSRSSSTIARALGGPPPARRQSGGAAR